MQALSHILTEAWSLLMPMTTGQKFLETRLASNLWMFAPTMLHGCWNKITRLLQAACTGICTFDVPQCPVSPISCALWSLPRVLNPLKLFCLARRPDTQSQETTHWFCFLLPQHIPWLVQRSNRKANRKYEVHQLETFLQLPVY